MSGRNSDGTGVSERGRLCAEKSCTLNSISMDSLPQNKMFPFDFEWALVCAASQSKIKT